MDRLKHFFQFEKKHTNFKNEVLSGITTFAAMAYVIILNPQVLSKIGLDFGGVMVASILITAFSTLFMGLFANLPIAIAPALGVSTFIVYSLSHKYAMTLPLMLSASALAGFLLFVLNILKIRQKILDHIPKPIFSALIVGIGLFLIMVSLTQIGAVIPIEGQLVRLGKFHHFEFYATIIGFLLILLMHRKGIRGAFLYMIILLWALSIALNITQFNGIFSLPPSLYPTMGFVRFSSLFQIDFYKLFFSIFLVSLFDSSAGILMLGKMLYPHGKLPKMQKALTPDSVGSTIAPFLGTSALAIHLESAAGITSGGRTGLTSLVTAILFLLCLFFYPLVSSVPSFASAPVLMTIGYMMCLEMRHLNWKDFTDVLPAMITIIIMPITFSIYLGFASGFIAYTGLKVLTGKYHSLNRWTIVLSILFLIHLLILY